MHVAMHYALKNYITVLIFVPDSGIEFSKLVPTNSNRSATLIENQTNCKRNIYYRFCLTVESMM